MLNRLVPCVTEKLYCQQTDEDFDSVWNNNFVHQSRGFPAVVFNGLYA